MSLTPIKDQSTNNPKVKKYSSIKYEDLEECFSTLFLLAERENPLFNREKYIKNAIIKSENIRQKKQLYKS